MNTLQNISENKIMLIIRLRTENNNLISRFTLVIMNFIIRTFIPSAYNVDKYLKTKFNILQRYMRNTLVSIGIRC